MGPVSRDTVIRAVDLYGQAWTTQNVNLLPSLFTDDAIYIERPYDKNATFSGLPAIVNYWNYQIVGKQSNIHFRHVTSDIVRDAEDPIAVVKWLAEFDNRREHRAGESSDKTYKRVQFCQMAKLIFKEGKICYLEEYAQTMTGPGVRWPGIGEDVSDEYLSARIRQVELAPKKVICEMCKDEFASRTKLFRHLKSTQPDGEGRCVQTMQQQTEGEGSAFAWVCMSLGYTCSNGVEDHIQQVLVALANDHRQPTASIDVGSVTWAVPLSYSYSAVVNIASIKMSKVLLAITPVETLPALLNEKLQSTGISVHMAVIVDRPCAQERREFEKYEAWIPWRVLQGQGTEQEKDTGDELQYGEDTVNSKGWSEPSDHCRRPLSETAAFPHVDVEMAKRLRNGARLLKDCGRTDLGHFADANNSDEMKVRVRTRTMEEPWQRLCRISVSMRQPRRDVVEKIVGLLLAYARSSLSEDELVSSALQIPSPQEGTQEMESSAPLQKCLQSICLLEPSLTKYEGKIGIKLCGDSNDNATKLPKAAQRSIERMEVAILA